jgi:hypothetical protein
VVAKVMFVIACIDGVSIEAFCIDSERNEYQLNENDTPKLQSQSVA